jgi:hypothetical protein
MEKEWQNEARHYMASKATGGKAKVVGAKSDSEDCVVGMEITEPLMKKVKELQVASSLKVVSQFNKAYITEGHKVLKKNGDHALMLFITCPGVPPHIIDSDEFRALCTTINANYKPACATTLPEGLIPNECARISIATLDYLKTQCELTMVGRSAAHQKPQNHC